MPKTAKWRLLSEEEFADLVRQSRSIQDLALKIGYEKTGGGTQTSLKKAIEERGLDISHFLGQGWNKENYDFSSFTKNSNKKNGNSTRRALIKLRGHKCEKCGNTEWLEQPINLEVHHINGNRNDNTLENLQLLCPNCHSYTDNFCYKSKHQTISEEDYVLALKSSQNISQALKLLGLTPAGGNYARAREIIEKYQLKHLYS